MLNQIIKIAESKRKRKYITPEDVEEALQCGRFTTGRTRMELLEIMGKQTKYGVRDGKRCAFLAWQGKTKTKKEAI